MIRRPQRAQDLAEVVAQDDAKLDSRIMWLYGKRALQTPVGNLNLSTAISDKPAEYVVTGVIPPGEARYLRAVVRTRRIPQQVSVFMLWPALLGAHLSSERPAREPPGW